MQEGALIEEFAAYSGEEGSASAEAREIQAVGGGKRWDS